MRALAVARRILDQMRRDPRTLALILIAPLFIVFLLHEVVTAGEVRARIAVAGSESLAASLEKRADVLREADRAEAEAAVAAWKADASIYLEEGEGLLGPAPVVELDASDPSASAASMKAIRDALAERAQASLPAFAKAAAKSAMPEIHYVGGSASTSTFDFLAPVLLCFLVFFFTFILSGIAFLRERSSGTLERAFAAPVRRRDLALGYMLGFGAVATIQTAVLQAFIVGVYAAPNAAGFAPALAVNLSVAFCALAMGLFLSAYANSEFQMLQFIPIVIVPQILFAGIFDLRSGGAWMTIVSYLFPLTYAGEALRDLMVRGKPIADALPDIAALWAFGAAFLALAVAGLGRYRKA